MNSGEDFAFALNEAGKGFELGLDRITLTDYRANLREKAGLKQEISEEEAPKGVSVTGEGPVVVVWNQDLLKE